jgi:uncharacterized repeat protein (TIGR03803 family)
VQGIDGALFGTTQEGGSTSNGGSSGYGTVFKLNPDGTSYEVLHNFDPSTGDGKYPNSGLVEGNDGGLYGTTEWGGNNNLGALFKINPDGTGYRVLYSFGANFDGSYPKAPLVRASDGGLFGTTQFGGEKNFGTIFRLAPSPARISWAKALENKMIQISIKSAPSFVYRIEGSQDHKHWTALTNIVNTTGTMLFTDSEAPNLSQRFYRAVWVP